MSFILDALKKAELRRGQPPAAVPVETPLGDIAPAQDRERSLPVTTLALASGILVIAALAWWLGRQSTPQPATADAGSPTVMVQLPVDEGSREIRPLDREADRSSRRIAAAQTPDTTRATRPAAGLVAPQSPARRSDATASLPQPATRSGGDENLPGYEELVLSGRVQLPALHLDIHVYAAAPERRFVFVNNRKYRQGEQLDEGGRVERITRHGAVLNFRGHRFELAPD